MDCQKDVLSYPVVLDWFLVETNKKFLKDWLCNILNVWWCWYCFNFSLVSDDIHSHGLAKLNSDPDLSEDISEEVAGCQAHEKVERVVILILLTFLLWKKIYLARINQWNRI